mmetsp:Transcript_4728/g.10087  ORF Transcript_4728/g.10087 Transcript_4728/m.10087 type:complete len:321 (-) Transcript_4728:6-968(-)
MRVVVSAEGRRLPRLASAQPARPTACSVARASSVPTNGPQSKWTSVPAVRSRPASTTGSHPQRSPAACRPPSKPPHGLRGTTASPSATPPCPATSSRAATTWPRPVARRATSSRAAGRRASGTLVARATGRSHPARSTSQTHTTAPTSASRRRACTMARTAAWSAPCGGRRCTCACAGPAPRRRWSGASRRCTTCTNTASHSGATSCTVSCPSTTCRSPCRDAWARSWPSSRQQAVGRGGHHLAAPRVRHAAVCERGLGPTVPPAGCRVAASQVAACMVWVAARWGGGAWWCGLPRMYKTTAGSARMRVHTTPTYANVSR